MKRWCAVVVIVAAAMLAGCGAAEPEPTYKGKPLSHWLAATKDADAQTAREAYAALVGMARTAKDLRPIDAAFASGLEDPRDEVAIAAAAANTKRNPQRVADRFISMIQRGAGVNLSEMHLAVRFLPPAQQAQVATAVKDAIAKERSPSRREALESLLSAAQPK